MDQAEVAILTEHENYYIIPYFKGIMCVRACVRARACVYVCVLGYIYNGSGTEHQHL